MRIEILLLILGMTLVTYLPRALPLAFFDKLKLSGKAKKFLSLIPYTAMSALIFPGIFSSDANNIAVGIIGGGVAAVLALLRCPVMVCVIGAIAADMLLYFVI